MAKKANQRADVKNPNNPSHKADQDNRSRQLNVEKQSPVKPTSKK